MDFVVVVIIKEDMSTILSKIIQWWYAPDERKNVKTDIQRSLSEIITSRGFKAETHEVTTEDGYILTLFRAVNPRNEHRPSGGKPILLMHGFGGNAAQFIVTSDDGYLKECEEENFSDTDNSLCFFLGKRGYDVWMGNMRGSRYSLKHKRGWKLTPDSEGFWNFSLDEIVKYDLPACIDYILNTTGSPTLGYVGVSLGTTIMFGLLSSQPEYNDLIHPFVALAPCYRLYNMKSPFKYPLKYLAKLWYKYPRIKPEFSLKQELALHKRTVEYPVTNVISKHFFWWVMGLLGGYNYEQFDLNRLPVYAAHQASIWWPWKQLIHSSQYVCRNIPFSKFDYGPEKNIQLYGTVSEILSSQPLWLIKIITKIELI